MAAHKASPLQLSSELEREPNQLVRAHSTPQRLAARARIIMVASAGPGIDETARQLGIWRKTAGYWRRRRLNAGVSAGVAARLSDAPRLRAPDAVCQTTALACEDPEALGDPDQSLEPKRTARQFAARCIVNNISHGSVGRVLSRRPTWSRIATVTG